MLNEVARCNHHPVALLPLNCHRRAGKSLRLTMLSHRWRQWWHGVWVVGRTTLELLRAALVIRQLLRAGHAVCA